MKKTILAVSAGILFGCSSAPTAPTLATPKGKFVDLNTDITFLLPETESAKPPSAKIRSPFAEVTPDPKVSITSHYSEIRPLLTSMTSALPALVQSDGKNVPLYKALRTIVPTYMTVSLADDVAQNFRSSVSWTGGDQWPHVLRKMLDVNGLKADVSRSHKEVIVRYAQKVSVPVKAPAQTTGTAATNKANTATVLKAPLIPKVTEGTKPVASMLDKSTPQLKHDPVIKIAPLAKPVQILKQWKLDKGTTLKTGYMAWTSKENCSGKGKWSVRWETDTDYPIDYPLSFSASNFEEATNQLFNLYRKAQVPLYVSGYRNQCLIIINDRK